MKLCNVTTFYSMLVLSGLGCVVPVVIRRVAGIGLLARGDLAFACVFLVLVTAGAGVNLLLDLLELGY